MVNWYQINNIEQIDSPALLVYPDRVQRNINLVKKMIDNPARLRPHVKTNKMVQVCRMMLQAGIKKFKCATIAEAEMLALAEAEDILLAYQPVGPKILRLINLQQAYPQVRFSCLVDNFAIADEINHLCRIHNSQLDVYLDLNVGMNRTGIKPDEAVGLANKLLNMPHIHLRGIHVYDGHIHDSDLSIRVRKSNLSYALAQRTLKELQTRFPHLLTMVIGGTPTFSIHAQREECECSPGTFVFWDEGYKQSIQELPCEYAALVLARVISIIDEHHICIDLGYKAIASENPLPRVHFLNAPSAYPVAHSEEHLVLKVSNSREFRIGTALYGVPTHICPTVAQYSKASVIQNNEYIEEWEVTARSRFINY